MKKEFFNFSFKLNLNLKSKFAFAAILLGAIFISACGSGEQENSPPDVLENTSISQFSFLKSNNPDLPNDIDLEITDGVISGRTPAKVNVENLVATFEHGGSEVTINGEVQTSGTTAIDFTHPVIYSVKTSDGRGENYQVDLTKFTGLPIISLETAVNAPINSKEDYVYGTVSVDGGRSFSRLAATAMKIRGRGNSTWGHPKKPYQMKLAESQEFLTMPEEKKWLFIAEYSDKTMLRNTMAFELSYLSSLDWTPKSTFAEVFLNGDYNGTYNITEKVEESDVRVALGDTGYLLEIDQFERLDPDDVYFHSDRFLINIKEPDVDWGSAEYNYIENLINEFESVLFSEQFNHPTNGYASYIDIDSFIDWYLISEITKNVDSQFFSSIYFNVIPGEKIKMGPLWDFDLSFGNVDYADSRYSHGYWVKYHQWYSRLFEDDAFVEKLKLRFAYFREHQNFILEKIDSYANRLRFAQQENDNKWNTIGTYVWPNPVVFHSYKEEVEYLKNWYINRMNWLETAFDQL